MAPSGMLRWASVRRAPGERGAGVGARGVRGVEDGVEGRAIRAGPGPERACLPEETFPAACPFTLDQVTGDWLPEA